MIRVLDKPEYMFRPQQLLARLLVYRRSRNAFRAIRLPWGVSIRVRPEDTIGRAICHHGIYELLVSEAIFRLLEAGEFTIDIGANMDIRQARWLKGSDRRPCVESRTEQQGFKELTANVSRWSLESLLDKIVAHRLAASSKIGQSILVMPVGFANNSGLASLESTDEICAGEKELTNTIELDQFLDDNASIGLMKIDVEGHEPAVFKGASRILASKRIRDILFEGCGTVATPAPRLLRSFGYTIFQLRRTLFRPLLTQTEGSSSTRSILPTFLATIDPERARNRFTRYGWVALGR